MNRKKAIDIAVFAPHPDDGELGAGGFLIKMRSKGYRTAIIDLTQGEMGTKGTPKIRAKEASEAAQVLGLSERISLDLGDGQLADETEQRREVISVIRILKPRLILTTWDQDEHPDHRAAYHLLRAAFFMARLPKIATGQPFHAPEQLWTYGIHYENPNSFVVDITGEFEEKNSGFRMFQVPIYQS